MKNCKGSIKKRSTSGFRIEETTHESTRLRCQLDLLLADKQQHHLTLQHMHKSIKDLKEQLKNKTEVSKKCSMLVGFIEVIKPLVLFYLKLERYSLR